MSASTVSSVGVPARSTPPTADSARMAQGTGDAPADLFQGLMQALTENADASVATGGSTPFMVAGEFPKADDTLAPSGPDGNAVPPPDFLGLGVVFAQSLPTLPPAVPSVVSSTLERTTEPLDSAMASAKSPSADGSADDSTSPTNLLLGELLGQKPLQLATAPSTVPAYPPSTVDGPNLLSPAQAPASRNPTGSTVSLNDQAAQPDWRTAMDTAAGNKDTALDAASQTLVPSAPDIAARTHHIAFNATDTPGLYRNTLQSQPSSPAFPAELASEIRFLVKGGLQHAELRMNPAELGPIQIELNLNTHVADIGFTAAHAATREGIVQSLPQLREMLSSQGLSLGQTSVGAEAQSQQQAQQERLRSDNPPRYNASEASGARVAVRSGSAVPTARGVLDLYA